MHYSTWTLELVSNIFWVIVGRLHFVLLYKTLKSYSLYVNFFFFLYFFLIFPNVSSISQYLTESNKPDHDNTDIFFVFFPLQKDFDICSGLFLAFLLFFFRNILISFTCFFSKPFFVCWIIFTDHFYIYKKKKKKL